MSLRIKFAALLGLLALAVLGGAAAAAWSFNLLHAEISAPFANLSETLRGLATIKRQVEEQSTIVLGPTVWEGEEEADDQGVVGDGARIRRLKPAPEADDAERFEAAATLGRRVLDEQEATEGWRVRAGQGAGERLASLIDQLRRDGERWFATGDRQAQRAVGRAGYTAHELIERMESRILGDARLAAEYGDRLRMRLLIILGLTIAIAVMTGILGQFLVRRWVLKPVQRLREAAEHIGRGDFAHRVEVSGSDEMAQLAGEVNHMTSMIKSMQDERVDRERLAAVGEMVRRLAHNIRNPLAGIRGLAELSRAELEPGSDLRENQQRIIDAVDRFERWLADLLRASRPADIVVETTPVRPWLAATVESHRPMAQSKGVELVVNDATAPAQARFDPRHLEHALVAILANAIAATPAGGRVEVRAAINSPGQWFLEVTDQGPGVAPELREKIFAPYFTTKKDGTGIGLAVALHVVRAHGGRILVDQASTGRHTQVNEHRGARFTVHLPTEPAPEGQASAADGRLGAPSGHNSGH